MNKPNTENVCFMDEYPHLEQKVRLRHESQPRSIGARILQFANEDEQFDEMKSLMEEAPQSEKLFEL